MLKKTVGACDEVGALAEGLVAKQGKSGAQHALSCVLPAGCREQQPHPLGAVVQTVPYLASNNTL